MMTNKTDAELHYIARDAGKAAANLDKTDEAAACKYLDQMADALSELRRRGWRPEQITASLRGAA